MKQYRTDQIRNIAIIAHSGAGKTSLVEAMLYNGGAIERMGAVDSGNSVADYAADEIERKTTLNCSVCIAEWEGHKLNLIDTPGAEDFYGDLHSVLRVVDAVVVVVDATTGSKVAPKRCGRSRTNTDCHASSLSIKWIKRTPALKTHSQVLKKF